MSVQTDWICTALTKTEMGKASLTVVYTAALRDSYYACTVVITVNNLWLLGVTA